MIEQLVDDLMPSQQGQAIFTVKDYCYFLSPLFHEESVNNIYAYIRIYTKIGHGEVYVN